MNSGANSDSEQFTELKLSRVHTLAQPTRTGRAHYAQAARTTPRPVVSRQCRGVQGVVSQAQHRPCRRPPQPYHSAHACATARRVAAMSLPYRQACRDTLQHPSLRLSRYNRLYHDTLPSGQASLSCHDTILCIAKITPSQAARARCRPCRGLPWSCCSLAMVVSWAWMAVSWPLLLRLGLLCHDTIPYIVT